MATRPSSSAASKPRPGVRKRAAPPAAAAVVKAAALPRPAPIAEPALRALARQLQSWTTSVLGMAGTATDLGVTIAKSRLRKPQHKVAVEKAGSLLHELRTAAGLTVNDLGTALGLNDASEVELIESGKVAMPFELVGPHRRQPPCVRVD